MPRGDLLVRLGDRLHARGTVPLHREGGHALGDSSQERNDAGDVRGFGGLGHVPHDHLVDLVGIDAGPGQQLGDGDAAQRRGVHVGERRACLGERGTVAVDQNDFAHDLGRG